MTTTSDNKETVNDNIPLTIRNMEAQAPKQPRPRKIDQKANWSDSEDGKGDQARSNPIDIPPTQDTDPQPSTFYARALAPLRCTNIYPKGLSLGRGRGNFPLANWTSLGKGCWCRFVNRHDTPQTPPVQQEPEEILAVVAPTDRVQTYKGNMGPGKTRKPLANWTWVRKGNTMGRLTNNNRMEHRQGWRPNNHDDRTLDETENARILEGDVLDSDEGDPTSPRQDIEENWD